MNLLHVLFFCSMSCLCGTGAASWPSGCCLKTSSVKRLPVGNVVNCKVQKAGICPVDAFIIRTRKGQTFCFDPKADWVIKNVLKKEDNSCSVEKPKENPKKNPKENPKKNPKKKKASRGGRGGKRKGKQQKGSSN